jgi:hypothetical protein
LEPSRANIITNSEYLGGSDWIKSGNGTGSVPVITSNAAISPEGVKNATRVDLDLNGGTSSGDWSWVYQNFTSTGNDETFSMYVKAVDASNVGKVIAFGAVSFTAQSLTADWVRIESTSSAAVGGYGNGFRLRGTEGTSNTASFYVFGIQHEQNATYPTSYIPTMGTAQTRAADSCSVTGASDVIGQTEGTLYFEGSSDTIGGSTNLINFNFAANSVVINRQANGSIRALINTSSAIVLNSSSVSGVFKVAIAYKNGDSVLYVNGALADSSTNSFTFATALTEVNLGTGVTYFALPNQSKCNQALVFKERLTNAELATLTTL